METKERERFERFVDYINGMDFSKVIEFFNDLMVLTTDVKNEMDGGCREYHRMLDYTDESQAVRMLQILGAESFANGIVNPTKEERALYIGGNETLFVNPWTEVLEHADEFLDYIVNVPEIHFPEVWDAIKEDTIVKVAVHKTLTRIVEVKAKTYAEAEEWIAKNFEKCDPLMKCDSIGEYFTEILPN